MYSTSVPLKPTREVNHDKIERNKTIKQQRKSFVGQVVAHLTNSKEKQRFKITIAKTNEVQGGSLAR